MKQSMFTPLIVFLASFLAGSSDAVSCISCVWSISDSNPSYSSCYTNPLNETKKECVYCQTTLIFYSGGATVIQRSCADPRYDIDIQTNDIPTRNRCILTADPIRRRLDTKCYYPCSTDNCNNVTLDDIYPCTSDCSSARRQGYCDYTAGRCVCSEGWLGADCNYLIPPTTQTRSCVQCNEITDPACVKSTFATLCPASTSTYNFCTTMRKTVFDRDQNVLSSYVSRGCSAKYTFADECEFFPHTTDPLHPDAVELICTSSCDYDGCNTGLPDGLVSSEERKDLFCLVCESDRDKSDCALGKLSRTRCPSSARFCKSTSTYFVSERKDLNYKDDPEYRFEKIVRKCGGHALVSSCRSQRLGIFDAKKVTCEETCQTDGCNDGWPSRPKCSQCNSTYTNDGYDQCWSNPNAPTQCPKPYQSFCVSTDHQIKSRNNQDGFRQSIRRACSFHDIGTECSTSTFGNIEVENCNQSCTSNGCNLGFPKLGNSCGKVFISRLLLVFAMFLVVVQNIVTIS